MGPEKDAPERSGTTEGLMAKVGDTRPAEPRSPCQAPLLKTTAQAHRQPALPKRPQPQPHEDAFSTKTCAANKDPAHGRKQAHSARSTPAPIPAHATSTKLQHSALSSRKCLTTPLTKQDEVHGALTRMRLWAVRDWRKCGWWRGFAMPEFATRLAGIWRHSGGGFRARFSLVAGCIDQEWVFFQARAASLSRRRSQFQGHVPERGQKRERLRQVQGDTPHRGHHPRSQFQEAFPQCPHKTPNPSASQI